MLDRSCCPVCDNGVCGRKECLRRKGNGECAVLENGGHLIHGKCECETCSSYDMKHAASCFLWYAQMYATCCTGLQTYKENAKLSTLRHAYRQSDTNMEAEAGNRMHYQMRLGYGSNEGHWYDCLSTRSLVVLLVVRKKLDLAALRGPLSVYKRCPKMVMLPYLSAQAGQTAERDEESICWTA